MTLARFFILLCSLSMLGASCDKGSRLGEDCLNDSECDLETICYMGECHRPSEVDGGMDAAVDGGDDAAMDAAAMDAAPDAMDAGGDAGDAGDAAADGGDASTDASMDGSGDASDAADGG